MKLKCLIQATHTGKESRDIRSPANNFKKTQTIDRNNPTLLRPLKKGHPT